MTVAEEGPEWMSATKSRVEAVLAVAGVGRDIWPIPPLEEACSHAYAKISEGDHALHVLFECIDSEQHGAQLSIKFRLAYPGDLQPFTRFEVLSIDLGGPIATLSITFLPSSKCTMEWEEYKGRYDEYFKSDLRNVLHGAAGMISDLLPSSDDGSDVRIQRRRSDKIGIDQGMAQLEELVRRLSAIKGAKFEVLRIDE